MYYAASEYLNMEFDLKDLCYMLVKDPKTRVHVTAEEFLKEILTAADELNRKNRKCGKEERPYLSLEHICRTCWEYLGDSYESVCAQASVFAEEIAYQQIQAEKERTEKENAKTEEEKEWERQFFEMISRMSEGKREYDVEDEYDLKFFRRGMRVHPKIHDTLRLFVHTLRAVWAAQEDSFLPLEREEREIWFLKQYSKRSKIIITEELQNTIFRMIMDNTYIQRYVALYALDTGSQKNHTLGKALLWNTELLDTYWEMAEELNDGEIKPE